MRGSKKFHIQRRADSSHEARAAKPVVLDFVQQFGMTGALGGDGSGHDFAHAVLGPGTFAGTHRHATPAQARRSVDPCGAVSSLSSAPDPDSGRRTPVPGCADPLARAAAVGGDEYASHVAATGTFVRNQALVLGSRCDAQQLVHRVRAARARNAAIRSAGISHSSTNSGAMGNPARVA